MAGAPLGNRNGAKAKVWTEAINRALERRIPRSDQVKAIDEIADKFVDLLMQGDLQAFKEFGDRMEGKPAQSIEANVTGGMKIVASQLDEKA